MTAETAKEPYARHKKLERNIALLGLFAFAAVTVGGIVEIAPLFWIDNTIEKVQGMRPYTPLEQAGRDIYVREGCYVCHSQMIRPFRDENERYGHYSLAAESMYDHPFQWGSKRTGPDLASPHVVVARGVRTPAGSRTVVVAVSARRSLASNRRLATMLGAGVPFLEGGAGYLRQLHQGNIASNTGQIYHFGGGITYMFSKRPGRLTGLGFRADAHVYVPRKGYSYNTSQHPFVGAGAALLLAF